MNPVHTYEADSTYQVTLTLTAEFCGTNSLTYEVVVNIMTSLNEVQNDFAASIFPNPNDGQFNLRLADTGSERIQLVLFDVLGKKVLEDVLSNGGAVQDYPIDLKGLSSGVFFLSLRSSNRNQTLRLVID